MSACKGGASEGGMTLRSSGGPRERVGMQRQAIVSSKIDLTERSGESCVDKWPLSRETAAAGDVASFSAPTTFTGLFSRLLSVIGLSLTLFSVGTLLFIGGFFLSRDDLPFISNGRAIPFPPLFPHLDPAQLQLNKEEGIYYADNSSPGAPRGSGEHGDTEGAPRPLYLEQFTDPKLVSVSSEPGYCQTEHCSSSWLSVTPYDRVVIFLIDAMRFDFLLWDPDASNACEDNATKECLAAPSGLRPFYRNRMPFAHDLLRRSDADLQKFLLSLMDGKETPPGIGNSTTLAQEDLSTLETKLPPDASGSQGRSAGLPSIDNWGGNRFTRLYIFEADPPTATTQRLTGLATGSMPSFFSVSLNGIPTRPLLKGRDASFEACLRRLGIGIVVDDQYTMRPPPLSAVWGVRETFSASAVDVDSLLLQLKAANKTSVAIGDDTWDHSFGHLLTRLHVFPSLNIQDLHTVDDGVAAELPREFAKGDWTFLVGHVLGVDHVGHAAVLDSNFMHKKLKEMNGMLKNLLKLMLKHNSNAVSTRPTQTLFLVFGDHGMTEAGSHGGGSSEEVEAGLLSFSTLPAMLRPRTAQMLSPGTRLFRGRLPTYLQSHGAFRDSSGRRRVGPGSALAAGSPTAALGYGSRRVRQVGLAPTLSLLLGLPIPFNSMGRIIEDLVPRIASFVQECAPEAPGASLDTFKCDAKDDQRCTLTESEDTAVARTVRCSDLAYLTQLHHIASWQQHRAIMTHAALTGNRAVLSDPQFAAAKVKWLRLYSELDKEIKSLPPAAHVPLTSGSSSSTFSRREFDTTISLPTADFEAADAELLSQISRSSQSPADGLESDDGDSRLGTTKGVAAGAASVLPSLVPYLRASAEFSQEAWQASVRQLCTFNIMLMLCGIFMALSSLIILGLAVWALRNPFSGCTSPTPAARIACNLPESATIARWLFISASISGGTWATGWALLKIFSSVMGDWASVLDVFLWRQLPALCLTGALCSVVVPFARSTLSLHPSSAQRDLPCGSRQGEDKSLASAWGIRDLVQQHICHSRLWLALFGGGRLPCYAALLAVCLVPFNNCYVERECSVVKFLISTFCILAGLTVFATPSAEREKKQIIAACGGLAACVRIGSAFDPFARSAEKGGASGWPLQIDSASASAFLMLCIYCVVGMGELPLIARLFGSGKGGSSGGSANNSRFRIASFHPLRGLKGARPCTLERDIFLVQGAIAVLWFAFPHDSKSPQPASQASQHNREGHSAPIYDVFAFLWSAIVFPFKVLDASGATFIGWLTPREPWLFTAPRCLLGVLPSQLLDDGQVKLVPLLNALLPWVIYLFTAGLWMRLVLILCRMKMRENDISRQQLRIAKEELIALGEGFKASLHADGPSQQNVQRKERGVTLWSIELWEYFAHYFFLTAVCPLCMFAVLLGRVQLWPLLLSCIKWRLLLFLGRVLVVERRQMCNCSFCRARRTSPADRDAYDIGYPKAIWDAGGYFSKQEHRMHFFLSDSSFCMMASLLALDTFFVTGHRTKLSALPVEAGFVGLLEFHPLWSFVTSFLHTILMGVTFKHVCSLLSLILLRQSLFIWDLFAVKFLYDTTAACLMYVLILLTLFIVGIGAQRAIKVMLVT
ncbi:uncharacterized protein EMH_0002360 [Eimeria mitis]|uniref:GPI ethanolamine phosphate transferase 3 n=1 Tax=Eimeria mitis TaxID=44415 RepID=U6KF53_9EIME|nr:uncharacterized protein EMH_0002360 [Eimeria mitis]CDJ36670.1 hypothetical protein, conserved [Eimeria mitis]